VNKHVVEPERRTAVVREADVVVVGGGTAGFAAAVASARAGAATVLIEQFGTLGGCGTVGRCFHLSNTYVDADLKKTIAGISLEVIDRTTRAGGTPFDTLEETLLGKLRIPNYIVVDPEIMSIVMMQMAEEAGVDMMLNTHFFDAIMHDRRVSAVIVQNKAGRHAVVGHTFVDATGEADLAVAAGAPCRENPADLSYGMTFGLLLRIGGVDTQRFLDAIFDLDPGRDDPEFTALLSRTLGKSEDDLRQDPYWRRFMTPQPVQGVPITHPGSRLFTAETQRWFKERWEAEGIFAYLNMHLLRPFLKKAVQAGDLELTRKVEGFGEVGFNFDGATGTARRMGEVLFNTINPMNGFYAFDTAHITKVEVASRYRALELARFLAGYVPGFERSYIVDTGVQTMPRHPRMIQAEYTLTLDDARNRRHFEDCVFLNVTEPTPGTAHEVPYRMMVPQMVENLLVSGKSSSGAHVVRPIPGIMALGHAAGAAAALCARTNESPRRVDVALLQETLRGQGAVLDLTQRESLA
jgi:hypothetical protein